jgi:hypothetical protein
MNKKQREQQGLNKSVFRLIDAPLMLYRVDFLDRPYNHFNHSSWIGLVSHQTHLKTLGRQKGCALAKIPIGQGRLGADERSQ